MKATIRFYSEDYTGHENEVKYVENVDIPTGDENDIYNVVKTLPEDNHFPYWGYEIIND